MSGIGAKGKDNSTVIGSIYDVVRTTITPAIALDEGSEVNRRGSVRLQQKWDKWAR